MKYNINARKLLGDTLIFWLQKFLSYKLRNHNKGNIKQNLEYSIMVRKFAIEDIYTDIDEIELDIKNLRRLGNQSINNYFLPVSKFIIYINNLNMRSIKEITNNILGKYISSLPFKSVITINNHQKMILLFFEYIDINNGGMYNYNHSFNFKLKSIQKNNTLPQFLNKQELKLFCQANKKFNYPKQHKAMNILLIKILVHTGIRVEELITLKLKNIYHEDNYYIFKVKGKGEKERIVSIKEDIIINEFKTWKQSHKNSEYLFLTLNFNKISSTYVYTITKNLLEYANINKLKRGPHLLRHTFATHLYSKYKDLLKVQKALGHEDINTSQIYVHMINEDTTL